MRIIWKKTIKYKLLKTALKSKTHQSMPTPQLTLNSLWDSSNLLKK
jgi:hypothetical protein